MTLPIVLVLSILALAILLFVSERLRMDVVALLVLGSLVPTGLLTPSEALSGFSNPAVVTVWAMFILSGGLSRTGVANLVGHQIMRLIGHSEVRLLVVIMLTSAILSAFMNNVGVAALMLPVVMDIARRTGRSPAKLLMPLAFGSLLGGLNTLIGTPPNLLISTALREHGLQPFRLFDYTPVGLIVTLVGIAYMVLIGRHLLPSPRTVETRRGETDLKEIYRLHEQMFVVSIPPDSVLAGKTLRQSRLGSALGLNVIGILRHGQMQLAPDVDALLQAGDRLLVEGAGEKLAELGDQQQLVDEGTLSFEQLVSAEIDMAEIALSPRSSFLGQTLQQMDFRHRFGVNVLAIWRDGAPKRSNLQDTSLQSGDILLVQGPYSQLDLLRDDPNFLVSSADQAEVYRLHERLMAVRVPAESGLVDKTLAESRLGDAFGLTVLGIVRDGTTHLMPAREEKLQAADLLLVEGKAEDLRILRGLQGLAMDTPTTTDLADLESERIGLVEVVLSPHATLAGKTLSELHFREKYGLNVLAIWHEGRAYGTDLSDVALHFGDALLLYGSREKIKMLGSEPDFLVLTEAAQETPRWHKAPLATLVMAVVILPALLGWLPIAISAVIGAALMVVTNCLTMEEAYRFIEWRPVFLIAGMLPLGLAMEQSGAAEFLAEGMVATVGRLGPLATIAGLYILTTLATQVMPNPVVAVLLAPIALNTAADLAVSPYTLMMTVALAASASFLSPVAHPANVLVMGPGGYRFRDYVRVGAPLTLVILAVVLLVLPLVWPLTL